MSLKDSNPIEISFSDRLYYQHVNPAHQFEYFYTIKLCYISRSLSASSGIVQDSSHVVQVPVVVHGSKMLSGGL